MSEASDWNVLVAVATGLIHYPAYRNPTNAERLPPSLERVERRMELKHKCRQAARSKGLRLFLKPMTNRDTHRVKPHGYGHCAVFFTGTFVECCRWIVDYSEGKHDAGTCDTV